MNKGTRVKVVRGRNGIGVTGVIFWVGDNKYGDGKRFGIEGDDGETYWIAEENVEVSTEAPTAAATGADPVKGSKVKWKQGQEEGFGTVFWVGGSKSGPGLRVGLNDEDGETRWLNAKQIAVIGDDEMPAPSGPPAGDGRPEPGFDQEVAPASEADDRPGPSWDDGDIPIYEDDESAPPWDEPGALPEWPGEDR